jgi:phage terminase large subunit-like protein
MFYKGSLKETVKSMPPGEDRDQQLLQIESLKGREKWEAERRPDQIPPQDSLWRVWIYAAGRGSGKTRTGAEEAIKFAEENPGSRLLLVARTAADVREVLVEGESGIFGVYGLHNPDAPTYKPSLRLLEWPNGSVAFCVSSEEPDAIRGVGADFAWADEVASWRRAKSKDVNDAWDNLLTAVRTGDRPRVIVTTTPRKTKMLKKLHRALKRHPLQYRLREASMVLNRMNLHDNYVRALLDHYYDSGLEKTEIHGNWPWKL